MQQSYLVILSNNALQLHLESFTNRTSSEVCLLRTAVVVQS